MDNNAVFPTDTQEKSNKPDNFERNKDAPPDVDFFVFEYGMGRARNRSTALSS